MTLPAVPESEWRQYEADQFAQDTDRRIATLTAPPSSDSLTNPLGTGNMAAPPPPPPPVEAPPPPPAVMPEPPPQPVMPPPEPVAPPPPPVVAPPPPPMPPGELAPVAPPVAMPTPTPAPVPPPPVAPAPAPTPTATPDQGTDWFGNALTAASHAGADVASFATDLGTRVAQGGEDIYGHAINAAANAGADVQAFANSFTYTPPAPTQPAVSPTPSQSAVPSQAGTGQFGAVDSSSPAAFARSVAPYAQYAAQQLGIDPSWVVAMMASESNYGKAPGNELFGIKALPGQKAQTLATHEGEYGGTNVNQSFAAYDTPLESVDAYINLLKKHYPGALGASDLGTFVHGLKSGGYFTAAEGEYRNILSSIANRGDIQAGLQQGLSSAAQGVTSAVGGATSAVGSQVRSAADKLSQFGDASLSNDEAYSACGPAAAVRFAQMFGRNPTLREAVDLAKSVGWSAAQGMAGLGSEKSLMDKLGIATRQVGADIQAMATEALTGNPVTISTPGHYFTADGYDQQSGAFHVGQSGLDLKGGSEWMTPDQMSLRMGPIQGALFADNPGVPAPSTADAGTNPASFLDRAKSTIGSAFSDLGSTVQQAAPKWWADDQDVNRLDMAVKQASSVTPEADKANIMGLNSDSSIVSQLWNQITGSDVGQGVTGRLAAVAPSWEEVGSHVTSPTPGEMGVNPVSSALGTGFSALGTGVKTAGEIGNELSPFTAISRVATGYDYAMSQDPQYQQLQQQYNAAQDQAQRSGSWDDYKAFQDIQDQLAARGAQIRSSLSPVEASKLAWNSPDRERNEIIFQLEGGLAAGMVAPEGLASGVPRALAATALDPGSLPFNAANEALLRGGAAGLRALGKAGVAVPSISPARAGIVGAEDVAQGTGDAATFTDRLASLDTRLRPPPTAADPYSTEGLMRAYDAVTPDRIASVQRRTLDYLAPLVTPRGGDDTATRDLLQQVWNAGTGLLQDSRVTATGLTEKAAAALADSGTFTNKLNAVGTALDSARATRAQVGVGRVDMSQAEDFVRREAAADRMALGSTQALDDLGTRDPDALNRMYAYTTAGPPLLGPQKPAVWLAWEDQAPRVVTAHHHYGVGSPNADIHASTPPGLKSLMWDPAATQGDRAAGLGGDSVINWEQHGLDVGGGRKIAQTDNLVGPSGENDMRMATALASMPADIQKAIRNGSLSDPEQIASILLRESPPQSAPGVLAAKQAMDLPLETKFSDQVKQSLALGAVDNGKRTESLMVDPQLQHVKAIYIAGTPRDLNLPGELANVAGRSRLKIAQDIRRQIQQKTGKDVPIIFKDITPEIRGETPSIPSKLLSEARTLEGPADVTLAPGRRRIVQGYTAAGFPNIGLLPQGRVAAEAAPAVDHAQTLYQRLQDAPMLTADDAARTLGSTQLPEYLKGVVQFLTNQRAKLSAGEITPRDVAKAWILTRSSIQSPGRVLEKAAPGLEGAIGEIPQGAISRIGAQRMVRPEDATAAWMLTPQGKKALDEAEKGFLSPESIASLDAMRRGGGFASPQITPAAMSQQKVGGVMQDVNWAAAIPEVTRRINEAGRSGDMQALDAAVQGLRGVGENKTGFIKQLLGLGNGVTMDSNEINYWLTGIGDAGEVAKTHPMQPFLKDIGKAGPESGIPGYLQAAVRQRFGELRDMGYGADVPEDAYNHVMHHWLWDTVKNAETTHGVMYDAMHNALVARSGPAAGQGFRQLAGRSGLGAVSGAYGAGKAKSEEPGATPEDIAMAALGGAGSGAIRGALRGSVSPGVLSRVAEEARPLGGLLDANGRLMRKASDIEQLIRGDERPGLSQILGPAGELLSTVGGGTVPKFRPGAGLPIESILRTVEGARDIGPPSAETLRRMPNLMHMANGSPELQASLQRAAETNPALFDAYQQGVITHKSLIEDLAPQLGMTVEQFNKNPLTKGYNDAELLALRATALDQVGGVTDAAEEIAKLPNGIRSLSPEDKVAFVLRMNDAQQLVARAKGGGSTAARTLNQQKINMTRELARSISSGNEAKAAEQAAKMATTRASRADRIAGAVDDLKNERAAAVREAQRVVSERTAGQPKAVIDRAQKDLQGQLKQINDLYDELGRYKAMSLAEKDEVFQREAGQRAQRAADRAEKLANKDPNAVEDLLKSLQDELGAEKKHFAKSRETWGDMAFWASKRGEILKQRGIEGQGEWLKAQAAAARKEADLANSRQARAFIDTSRAKEIQTQGAQRILERLGGKKGQDGINVTDEVLQKVVDTMAKGDPIETAALLRSLTRTDWWDRVGILRYAGMLSASTTHTAQALSNVGNLGVTLASHPFAVGADVARSALTGSDRSRYMAELGPMLRGGLDGLHGGFDDAHQILRSGINPADVSRNIEGVRSGFNMGDTTIGRAIGSRASGAIDVAAEAPLRVLESGDALFRGAARGAHTRGLATRQAINEGYRGAAMNSRAEEIMQNLAEHPDLVDQAEQLARRAVFQERRSDVGAFASAGRDPGSILKSIIFPFVRTPWNVAAQGMGLTPAGFLGAAHSAGRAHAESRIALEARQQLAELLGGGRGGDLANADLTTLAGRARAQGANEDISNLLARAQLAEQMAGKYGGEAADRAGRAVIGTGVMALGLKLAADGHLTAGYPDDANERSSLPPGWQPWAVRFDGPGGPTYMKYNQLGAIGVPLGISASMVDQAKRGQFTDPGKVVNGLVNGPLSYLTDTTMLQQFNNLSQAITDPGRSMENFAEQTATGFLPYSALGRQLQRAAGTPTRDPNNVIEALEATYPGLSGMVQEKLDPLGRTVRPTQTGLGAFVSPAPYGMERDDPTLSAIREARAGISAAPKDFRGFQMTPQEQRQFQRRAGLYIQQLAGELAADPTYQSGTVLEKQAAMRRIIENARAAAGADVLGSLTDDQLLQRRQLTEQAQLQRLYPAS